MTIDWSGSLYCGIHLDWNYNKGWVDISMPNYIKNFLQKFQHEPPKRIQYAPFPWVKPNFGATIQYPTSPDMSPGVEKSQITRIQQILGTLLYYSRMVDPTMLVAISSLASQQSKATTLTLKNLNQLLDYCVSFPVSTLRYKRSDMILKIHSDAGYLNESGSRSRSSGYFYLGNNPHTSNDNNGTILTNASILKNIMASAAEAEYGALFVNSRLALPIRMALEDLNHTQPPTPLFTDNETEKGLPMTIKRKGAPNDNET